MAVQKCTKCGEVKPLSEFGKSKKHRLGVDMRCMSCANAYKLAWAASHQESRRLSLDKYSTENKDKYNAIKQAWKRRNPQQNLEINRRWWRANPERLYQHNLNFYRKNPGRVHAWTAKRNAAKIRATPRWANAAAIEVFYIEAAKKTKESGIRHVVDHIVPLRGKLVCGLHVENNLQVITVYENARKSNKLLPECIGELPIRREQDFARK